MPRLEVRDIHTAYGLSQVLFGISFEVERGQVVALIGRNGVGKTTTMRSIIGLTHPSRGQVVWQDREITRWPAYRIAQQGIGFVPEDRRIFPSSRSGKTWISRAVPRRQATAGTKTGCSTCSPTSETSRPGSAAC